MLLRDYLAAPAARPALLMACLFGGLGVGLPFLSRWLEEARGLSGLEIGAILSSASLARIIIGPLVATWADGFADRRVGIAALCLGALAAYGTFAFVDGFWALFLAGFAATTIAQALTPLVEGSVLRAGQTGALPYGVARAFGSATFIIGNVVGGALMVRFGVDIVIVWVVASYVLGFAASLWLQPDPAPSEAVALGFRGRLRVGARLLTQPRFALTIASAGLIQAAHAFYYAFSPLVWREQGFSDGLVGILWAFGVIVEIAFLALLPRIERRITPEMLILIGGIAAVARWAALALVPPLWLVWPIQALHALTFAATHVGALRLVFREAPESVAGLAQTLYAAIASGTVFGLATLASGALYDAVGAGGYWAMAGLALLGLMFMPPLFGGAPRPTPQTPAPPAPLPESSRD